MDENGFAQEIHWRKYGKVAKMEYLGWKECQTLEEMESYSIEDLRNMDLPKDIPPPPRTEMGGKYKFKRKIWI